MIAQFLEYLAVDKRFSKRSLDEYLRYLTICGSKADLLTLTTYADVRELLLKIGRERAWYQNTLYKCAIVLSEFYRFATLLGLIQTNPLPFVPFRKAPDREPSMHDRSELLSMIRNPDISLRDLCIVTLLYETGVRRQEIANMNREDIDLNRRLIHVLGKGGKERWIPISRNAFRLLKFYCLCVNGGALFPTKKSGRISGSQIWKLISRLGREAQLKSYPHKWRHSLGGRLIENGMPQSMVQKILGHANQNMTAKYVHHRPTELKENFDRFHKSV